MTYLSRVAYTQLQEYLETHEEDIKYKINDFGDLDIAYRELVKGSKGGMLKTIHETALKEIEKEDFYAQVEKEKARLRERRSTWEILFPWKITITRR